MVILFVMLGILFGSVAAGLTVGFGGTIWLAILAYSMIGSITVVGAAALVFFLRDPEAARPNWDTGPDEADTALSV